jgi:2-hydroxymuconate-semialdehyde hydrolase
MIEPSEVLNELKNFIANELLDGQSSGLEANTPLLEWGVLDSLTMISLLTFTEERFDVQVPDTEVRPENFENLQALTNMLMNLLSQKVEQPKSTSGEFQTGTLVRVLASYGTKPQLVELSNGTEQHILKVSGKKPTWILLPPLGNPSTAWGEILRTLVDEQEALAVDLSGFGLSGSTRTKTTYKDHLEDILGLLETTVEPPVVLFGSSIVSMIATEIVRKRPQWIKALVIISFGLIEDGQSWWQKYRESSQDLDQFLAKSYYQAVSMPPPLRMLMKDAFARPTYTEFFNNNGIAAMSETFNSINVPTLFVAGENDCFISKADVEKAAARIPNAQVRWLARCGHFPQMERPHELLALIKNFLQNLPA